MLVYWRVNLHFPMVNQHFPKIFCHRTAHGDRRQGVGTGTLHQFQAWKVSQCLEKTWVALVGTLDSSYNASFDPS